MCTYYFKHTFSTHVYFQQYQYKLILLCQTYSIIQKIKVLTFRFAKLLINIQVHHFQATARVLQLGLV